MSGASYTDAALLSRHHATQVAFNLAIGASAPSSRVEHPAPGVVAVVVPTRPQRSIFNAVLYDDAATLIGALDEVAAVYDDAGVRAWTVWTDPADGELRAALETAGHALDAQPEVMCAALADMDLAPRTDAVVHHGSWAEVGDCNDAAYGMSEPTFGEPLAGCDSPEIRRYVVRDGDGRALAAAISVCHDGDCGIELVATRPEARGRGLASDLMFAALREARDDGCETTSLEATKLGASVYERMGYRRFGPVLMYERRV